MDLLTDHLNGWKRIEALRHGMGQMTSQERVLQMFARLERRTLWWIVILFCLLVWGALAALLLK
ncbi:hypothetical protein [Neptunicoccus cionae]|uniref:hypothetical protein n=1 Tax=Neptunicoccus cionae TaxID=2035344 RepID=UPI0011AE2128|nr:hypothetical protein [Amylibacter cionae]